MHFFLSSSSENKGQTSVTKVRIFLRTGIVEILEQHQNLIGQIANDIVEVETTFEGVVSRELYVIRNGVLVVTNQFAPVGDNFEFGKTSVFIYSDDVTKVQDSLTPFIVQSLVESRKKLDEELMAEALKEIKQMKSAFIKTLESEIAYLEKVLKAIKNK
jgi:F0F1-type ATP synthase epsilon subunit